MTPCHICGLEAVTEGPDPLCTRHLEDVDTPFEGRVPESIGAAVDALLDDESSAGSCRLLLSIEGITLGLSIKESALTYGVNNLTLLVKWRKFRKSRDANCVLHPGRCEKCT